MVSLLSCLVYMDDYISCDQSYYLDIYRAFDSFTAFTHDPRCCSLTRSVCESLEQPTRGCSFSRVGGTTGATDSAPISSPGESNIMRIMTNSPRKGSHNSEL